MNKKKKCNINAYTFDENVHNSSQNVNMNMQNNNDQIKNVGVNMQNVGVNMQNVDVNMQNVDVDMQNVGEQINNVNVNMQNDKFNASKVNTICQDDDDNDKINNLFQIINEKRLKCMSCQKEMNTSSFIRHQKICKGVPIDTCEFCKKIYSSRFTKSSHRAICKLNPKNNKNILIEDSSLTNDKLNISTDNSVTTTNSNNSNSHNTVNNNITNNNNIHIHLSVNGSYVKNDSDI